MFFWFRFLKENLEDNQIDWKKRFVVEAQTAKEANAKMRSCKDLWDFACVKLHGPYKTLKIAETIED